MEPYKQIAETVKSLVGTNKLYLDDSILIKGNGLSYPLHLWAVWVSPDDVIYVMNGEEMWHDVDPADKEIISALHTRMNAVAQKYIGVLVSATELENCSIAQSLNHAI